MATAAILDTRERVYAGIVLTSLAYLLFSVQDASIKLLVTAITIWQILFFREPERSVRSGTLSTGSAESCHLQAGIT